MFPLFTCNSRHHVSSDMFWVFVLVASQQARRARKTSDRPLPHEASSRFRQPHHWFFGNGIDALAGQDLCVAYLRFLAVRRAARWEKGVDWSPADEQCVKDLVAPTG